MEMYRFHVQIEDGKMQYNSPAHEDLWHRFLAQFNGKKVELEVIEKKSTRSIEQNNYYWVYLTAISRETGYDKQELHELFKGKFLSTGINEIFGEKVRKKASTTRLSVGRFVEYIMQIEEFTGIEAPDTTAYYGYSYHKPF